MFHSNCLQGWKNKGKNTCPVCRKVFDASQFKVTVTVQNNHTAVSNTVSLNESTTMEVIDLFDLSFDGVENMMDLDSILSDLGMSLLTLRVTINLVDLFGVVRNDAFR
jgi:hypothetical protein